MTVREQRYAQHLQELSDQQLSIMLQEYNFPDPYIILLTLSNDIVNFCQNYEPETERQAKISTMEIRLFSYMRDKTTDRQLLITQLKNELMILNNAPISGNE